MGSRGSRAQQARASYQPAGEPPVRPHEAVEHAFQPAGQRHERGVQPIGQHAHPVAIGDELLSLDHPATGPHSARVAQQPVPAADLVPQPDVAPTIRRARERSASALLTAPAPTSRTAASTPVSSPPPSAAHRPLVAPLGGDRYLVRVMLSHDGHEKLERARALLRHQIPNADPAAVIERALTTLVEQLQKTRHASTLRPRAQATTAPSTSRHVPAAVKRAVWARDDGRCAFVGANSRCHESGFLEFHHVVPFSAGGATDIENLQLRCRAHNAYEATLFEQSCDMTVNTPG